MIRIKLAGGVGEHGRSSFLVEGDTISFLVDCGLLAASADPYPHLTKTEIQKLSWVYLTHSHADHSGALPWLENLGFTGTVIATRETLSQLKVQPRKSAVLGEEAKCHGLSVRWGRSGHCPGSVWYEFQLEGKTLLFSGDYLEGGLVYVTDLIRNVRADIAVLDSAYGPELRSAEEMRRDFLKKAETILTAGRPLLLPVPQYGRGLEAVLLLHKRWPDLPIYGDAHFQNQLKWAISDRAWTTPALREGLADVTVLPLPEDSPTVGFCFVSNPQLRTESQELLARRYVSANAEVLLTGTVEVRSGSWRLQQEGAALFSRLAVHSTDQQREELEQRKGISSRHLRMGGAHSSWSFFSLSRHSVRVLPRTFFVFGRPLSLYPMTTRPSQRPSARLRRVPEPCFRFFAMALPHIISSRNPPTTPAAFRCMSVVMWV